jgi:hypothetical protein
MFFKQRNRNNLWLQTLQILSAELNRHLTKRAPDAGDSGAIPSLFLRLSIFPVGRRPAVRPSAGNASRWLASLKILCQFSTFVRETEKNGLSHPA